MEMCELLLHIIQRLDNPVAMFLYATEICGAKVTNSNESSEYLRTSHIWRLSISSVPHQVDLAWPRVVAFLSHENTLYKKNTI